jgi:hypothetical protein
MASVQRMPGLRSALRRVDVPDDLGGNEQRARRGPGAVRRQPNDDTDLAFGHLGFINIMGWADPERGISGGLTNSGKAIVFPELARFYALMQRIASEVPKVPASERPL